MCCTPKVRCNKRGNNSAITIEAFQFYGISQIHLKYIKDQHAYYELWSLTTCLFQTENDKWWFRTCPAVVFRWWSAPGFQGWRSSCRRFSSWDVNSYLPCSYSMAISWLWYSRGILIKANIDVNISNSTVGHNVQIAFSCFSHLEPNVTLLHPWVQEENELNSLN